MKPLALISGVGPGTGTSIARRFATAGYRTALLARDEARLKALAGELPGALALPCDVTDPQALAAAVEKSGPAEVVVHHAVGGAWGTFREIDPAVLERNFQTNVMALLQLARLTTPPMLEAGKGALIVTGNTSALRGKARFAGFAPTKAAQRILAESLARGLGARRACTWPISSWTRSMCPGHANSIQISRTTFSFTPIPSPTKCFTSWGRTGPPGRSMRKSAPSTRFGEPAMASTPISHWRNR